MNARSQGRTPPALSRWHIQYAILGERALHCVRRVRRHISLPLITILEER